MAPVKMTQVQLPVPDWWDVKKCGGAYNEIILKGHFAKRLGISGARITQLVDEGKISSDALVQDGVKQKLRFGPALIQAKYNRDELQALINGKIETPKMVEQFHATSPPDLLVPHDASLDGQSLQADRYKDIRVKRAELDLKKAIEEDRERNGRYMLTADVTSIFGETLSQIINAIETDFQRWAGELAADPELNDPVKIRNKLKKLYVETRIGLQKVQENMASNLPEFIADDVNDRTLQPSFSGGNDRRQGTDSAATH